jgi:hypothetical protein
LQKKVVLLEDAAQHLVLNDSADEKKQKSSLFCLCNAFPCDAFGY